MTRFSLLRSPAAAEGGASGTSHHEEPAIVSAKDSTPPIAVLDTEDFGDALTHLELPQAVKDGATAAMKKANEGKAESGKRKAEAPGGAAAEKKEEKKAAGAPAGEAPAKPEFTADQEAWLKLRAEAKTPEEIAELEKEIPEFNEEQTAWINSAAEAAEKAESEKAESGNIETPEFTDEQKPFVEKLQTDLQKATEDLKAQSKRVEELTAENEQLQKQPAPVAQGLHPLLLTDDPKDIDAHEQALEEFVAWGRQNWDGSEEVKDKDGKVTQRAYTAQEIRDAVTRRETELRKGIPSARANLQARQAQYEQSKKIYPALFDGKSEDAKLAQTILKQWPVLKAMPNVMTIIGDAIAGERLRVAAAKKNGKPAVFRIPAKAPKGPVRATPGSSSKVAAKPTGKPTPTAKSFNEAKAKAPSEMEALMETVGNMTT